MLSKPIDVQRASKLMEKKQAKLLDVRDPVSFRDGALPGAINVPLRNISSTLIKLDRKTPLIFVGGEDAQTLNAAINYAAQFGFGALYHIEG